MADCMPGWAKVPAELLTAPISDRAVRLWSVLERHQGGSGAAWPSRPHLAEHLGCSLDSIDRALAELEADGWLVIQRGRGRANPNLYAVIHRPRTGAAITHLNGRTGAAISEEKAAPVRRLKAAPVRPEGAVVEGDLTHPSAQGATARANPNACSLGWPIAGDGSCCPEHDIGQIPMWPAAVAPQ